MDSEIEKNGRDSSLEEAAVLDEGKKSPALELPAITASEMAQRVRCVLAAERVNPEFKKNAMSGTLMSFDGVEIPASEALIYGVDDDLLMQRIHRRYIEKIGFRNIQIFADAEDAVAAMYEGANPDKGKLVQVPHLILSDTQMPRMSGPFYAKHIQNIDPKIRPRFIALTGSFVDEIVSLYDKFGNHVLSKPFNLADYHDLILSELIRHPGFRPAKK